MGLGCKNGPIFSTTSLPVPITHSDRKLPACYHFVHFGDSEPSGGKDSARWRWIWLGPRSYCRLRNRARGGKYAFYVRSSDNSLDVVCRSTLADLAVGSGSAGNVHDI